MMNPFILLADCLLYHYVTLFGFLAFLDWEFVICVTEEVFDLIESIICHRVGSHLILVLPLTG